MLQSTILERQYMKQSIKSIRCNQDYFEFLKANRRKLMKTISSDEYNFNQIKLLAGQGSIYMKLKESFEYLLDPEYDIKSTDFDEL